jgi:hypothetical protein
MQLRNGKTYSGIVKKIPYGHFHMKDSSIQQTKKCIMACLKRHETIKDKSEKYLLLDKFDQENMDLLIKQLCIFLSNKYVYFSFIKDGYVDLKIWNDLVDMLDALIYFQNDKEYSCVKILLIINDLKRLNK